MCSHKHTSGEFKLFDISISISSPSSLSDLSYIDTNRGFSQGSSEDLAKMEEEGGLETLRGFRKQVRLVQLKPKAAAEPEAEPAAKKMISYEEQVYNYESQCEEAFNNPKVYIFIIIQWKRKSI